MKYIFYILLFIICGCEVETGTPESQIKSFVESRINHLVTREFILSKTTGKMKEIIENMSDVDFVKFSDLRQYQKESFKIHSKTCHEKKCFITYSVGYKGMNESQVKYLSEVKKIAELQYTDGVWLINDVSNIKSYIESFESIDALKE
jgi:hypothetical protein